MPKTTADRIAAAEQMIEAGFRSKADRKRALTELSYAYDGIKRATTDAILAKRAALTGAANEAELRAFDRDSDEGKALTELYYAVPMDLHQVRDRHFESLAAAGFAEHFAEVRTLINLRTLANEAEILTKPRDPQVERIETVRRSIIDEMKARHASYVEGLDMSRTFGMSVSVTAHYVTNEHGTTFLRHFFYLRGRLTALNTIFAIADTLKREEEGRA